MIKKPYIISVSAKSGGGKTTITKELCNRLSAKALHFDDFEYDKQPENIATWVQEGSLPAAWDLSIFVDKIKDIIANDNIDYIILDYPFGRQNYPVKDFIDMTIFIDTPLDIMLARRIIRDFKDATTIDIINDLSCYLESSRPCFVSNDEDKTSDLVVDGTLSINEITKIIIEYIKEHNCI